MRVTPPVRREPSAAAIVLAAGRGGRVGSPHNKVFLPLAGRRLVSWSLGSLAQITAIKRFVMVIREADRTLAEDTIDREMATIDVEIVVGGSSRHESELFALRHLAPAIRASEIDLVLIHDGARPLLPTALVRTLMSVAAEHGAAFPGLEGEDIRRVRPDGTLEMHGSNRLVRAQTPQAFDAARILGAYQQAEAEGFVGTDTSSCWEKYQDTPVRFVPGDPRNIKITFPGDLFLAEKILHLTHFRLD